MSKLRTIKEMTLSNAISEGEYQPAEDCSSKKFASYQTGTLFRTRESRYFGAIGNRAVDGF